MEEVLEAVTQADRLWQQAVKQLDANQLEGRLIIHFDVILRNNNNNNNAFL